MHCIIVWNSLDQETFIRTSVLLINTELDIEWPNKHFDLGES